MGMLSLIRWFVEFVEKATRPPEPPIDKTELARFISLENLEQMVLDAKTFYRMSRSDFNVAVVGAKSVGKSSLINGLLHLDDDDTNRAMMGGEGTREVKVYNNSSSLSAGISLWDFPGAGVVGHPSLTFFVDKKLYAFDLILIVSDRFRTLDFEIARHALHLGRPPFVFVRTKADIAMWRLLEEANTMSARSPSMTSPKPIVGTPSSLSPPTILDEAPKGVTMEITIPPSTTNMGNTLDHISVDLAASALRIVKEEAKMSLCNGLRLAKITLSTPSLVDDVQLSSMVPSLPYLFVLSCKAYLDPSVYPHHEAILDDGNENEEILVHFLTRAHLRRNATRALISKTPNLGQTRRLPSLAVTR